MDNFKTLLLRSLPVSLHTFLVREQAKIQLDEGKKISIERVIYRIIREKIDKNDKKLKKQ
jgi:hypothetical protein